MTLASFQTWLRARLEPGSYLRLHLTVGMAVLVAACWLFGGIAEDIVTRDPLVTVDQSLAVWLHSHATPKATTIAKAITTLGSPWFLSGVSTAAVLFLLARRSWYRALQFLLTMVGGALLNLLLKELFHRPRPVFTDPLAGASGFSFPSGHVFGATLFFGVIAYLIARNAPRRWGVFAILTALVLVAMVALTRMYLGVHYLSDTAGAFAAALAWLAICATGVETLERYRRGGAR